MSTDTGVLGGQSQQQASPENKKRKREGQDEPPASKPQYKARRTAPSPWRSDDEIDDDKRINNRYDDATSIEHVLASEHVNGGQCVTPEALQCTLYKHQLIALQWMTKQEQDVGKKGGILADDMGLGKTLTTISLMVTRKAEPPSPKTNLIVAPVALLRQWQREIQQKLKHQHQLRVFVMHGNAKASYVELRKFDVVLTTYGKLTFEYNKLDEYIRKAKEQGGRTDNDFLSRLCPIIGPLSIYHRIILDESQCIKNHKSKCAKAASRLQAKYRWCLSGTPMMNGPNELASLVHFLRIHPYDNIQKYMSEFKCLDPKTEAPRNAAMQKRAIRILRVLLSSIMLRRTKEQKIDGKPIVELKDKIVVVDYAVFDDDERDFYHALEKHSRVEFSKYCVNGRIGLNYSKILALLLRLRQACCHPHLHLLDVEVIGPSISDDTMVDTAKTLGPEIIEQVKEAESFQCAACADVRSTMNIIVPCGSYICTPCIETAVELAKQRSIQAGNSEGSTQKGHLMCPKCNIDSKVITYDAFTKAHMPQQTDDNMGHMDDDSSDDDSDDDVDAHGNLKGFVVGDDDDDEYVDKPDHKKVKKDKTKTDGPSSKTKLKLKNDERSGTLAKLRAKARSSKKAHKRYMKELRRVLLPSSKVTMCLEIISNIRNTTKEKIIVFSQWTFLLDILEVTITDKLGIPLCRFDGSMTASQRDDETSRFTTDPNANVILVSLKAGNAGLNLTAASQVILMDPFWNPYIENQAIDRAYRIGQQREVTVHRILVKETVEDRIVSIQDKKSRIVESALSNEKAAKSRASLGMDELAYIFGLKDH
ncbi:SNF2 family N-terminal domain-containing protein [Hypoxylon sp. FL1284]|nr:SNF2 family N-terminal domain-containing protein [Hypoxylon sp. FL1284]